VKGAHVSLRRYGILFLALLITLVSCGRSELSSPVAAQVTHHEREREHRPHRPQAPHHPGTHHPGHGPYFPGPHPGPWNPGGPWPGSWPYPQQPLIVSYFDAAPPSIVRGQPVTLSWSAWGATTVTIDGAAGGLPPSGSHTVVPTQTTVYTLHAYGQNGQYATRILQVYVQEPPARIVSFLASRTQITRSEVTTLRWYVDNCQHVQLLTTGDGAGAGIYGCEAAVDLRPQTTTTYSLQVTGRDGQTVSGSSVVVTVVAQPERPLVEYFNASHATIERGYGTRLRWNVRNANRISISDLPSVSSQSLSGEIDVAPLQTTTYVLRAYGEQGQMAESYVTVTVNVPVPPPGIVEFRADPAQIELGYRTQIVWNAVNCSRVEILGLQTERLDCAGALEIQPTETVNLALRVFGSRGEMVERVLTVQVIPPPAQPSIDAFYAATPHVLQGQTTTLHWQTSNASRVELLTPDTYPMPVAASLEVRPEHTTTYELRAYNARGEMTSLRVTVTVQVLSRPSIDYFYATPSIVTAGRPAKLTWKTNNCEWVRIIGYSHGRVGPVASLDITPAATSKVVLRAKGYNGEVVESSIMVGVAPEAMTEEQALDLLLSMMQGRP
jgi:hypothetical protein